MEVLISLALGAILLLGVFHVYLSSKNLVSATEKDSRNQDNLRFASHFLRRNVSQAGYAGCVKLNDLDLKNNTDFDFTFLNSIRGYTSDHLPIDIKKHQVAPNTDVLVIQKADSGISEITDKKIKKGATTFHVKENPATKSNKFVLLSDCKNADLFTAIIEGGQEIRSMDKIAHEYEVMLGATKVSSFTEIAYFISSGSSGANEEGKEEKEYGLYYAVNDGKKMPLVNGITSMKVRYGVDSKDRGIVDSYYTTEEMVKNQLWAKAKSVIITLTYGSIDVKAKTFDVYVALRER